MVKPRRRVPQKTLTDGSYSATSPGSDLSPTFKGVRQRGWSRWASEIRIPKSRAKIWLGTYPTAHQAARAYDVATLLLRGSCSEPFLNLPDSAALLPPTGHYVDMVSPRTVRATAAAVARLDDTSSSVEAAEAFDLSDLLVSATSSSVAAAEAFELSDLLVSATSLSVAAAEAFELSDILVSATSPPVAAAECFDLSDLLVSATSPSVAAAEGFDLSDLLVSATSSVSSHEEDKLEDYNSSSCQLEQTMESAWSNLKLMAVAAAAANNNNNPMKCKRSGSGVICAQLLQDLDLDLSLTHVVNAPSLSFNEFHPFQSLAKDGFAAISAAVTTRERFDMDTGTPTFLNASASLWGFDV